MTVPQPARLGLILAAVILVLDQASKTWIVDSVMNPPQIIDVLPFFSLVMVWNRGISFGLFNGADAWNAWVMPAMAGAISVGLLEIGRAHV